MAVFNNALAGAAGSSGADAGYKIERSLRFNKDDSAFLRRDISSAGNSSVWTYSCWVKRNKLGTEQQLLRANRYGTDTSRTTDLYFDPDNTLRLYTVNSSTVHDKKTAQVFRDVGSWMHVTVKVNLPSIDFYINGVQVTDWATNTESSGATWINTANPHLIGRNTTNGSQYADFQLAECHLVDGQALDPTAFGEFDADTGVWNPIEYTGSHTTTGGATGTLTNYNNNTSLPTYSDQDNNSGTPSVYQMENAFDGNSSTYANMTYANGKWTRANFAQPITNVTRIDIGWDGEGDVGYNGSVVNSSVGYNGSRQSLTLYNNSGSPITLNNIHMVSQAGNGVCRLYDITITTTTQSATELTFSSVPAGPNGFHLDFDPDAGVVYSDAVQNANNAATNLFDGSLSSYTEGSTDGTAVTWTGNVSGNTIEFYGAQNAGTRTFSVNGVDRLSLVPTTAGWFTIPNTTSLTSFSFSRGAPSGGFVDLYAIRVDGKILVDHEAPGVDASGNGNHWTANNLFIAPEDGTFDLTTASLNPSGGASYETGRGELYMAFDGSTDSYLLLSNQNNHGINFSPGISVSSKVEIWGLTSNQYASTNLVGSAIAYTPGQWTTLFNGSGTLNHITMISNNNRPGLAGIRVDGVELIARNLDTDSLIDSPTNYIASSGNNGGNYCTFNPLVSNGTLSNGNLDVTTNLTGASHTHGTIAFPSYGKWYYEITPTASGDQAYVYIGDGAANVANSVLYYGSNGNKRVDGTFSSYGDTYGNNDVIGVAVNVDDGEVTFYKNGVSQGAISYNITGKTLFPAVADGSSGAAVSFSANWGQRPFAHPLTGFKSLCTANLDDPLIENPSEHFDTKLWTGNGGEQIVGGGIRYSDYVTGDIDPNNPAWRAFRNVTSQIGVRTQTANGATIVFQPPSPIAFSSSFKIWAARDGTHSGTSFTVTHAGGTTDFTSSVVTSTTQTAVDLAQISGVTSPITKITVVSGGPNPRFSGIEVDGSMLIDSTADAYEFSPDLVWIKARSLTKEHALFDTVRGANKRLQSSTQNTETTHTDQLSAFISDGFKVKGNNTVNQDSATYCGWSWNGGDLATNSAYNQSQDWTSLLTSSAGTISNPGNSFDGLTSTTSQLPSTSPGSYIQLGATLTGVTKLEIYQRSASDVSGTGIQTYNNCPAAQWVQLTLTSSTISNIRFEKNTNDPGIYAIRVNDKILVDKGVIPVGSLNSTIYNTSQNWSVSGSNMQNNWATSFDGKLSPTFALPNTGYSASMTFPNAISYQTLELVVSRDLYAPDLLMNGNALNVPKTDTNTTGGRYKIERFYFTDGTLTSIGHETRNTAGRGGSGFWQIIVDGKILVDTNQASSAPNVPSIATTCTSNPTAGFAISTYKGNNNDGASIAHNLGSTPEMVIVKARNKLDDWRVYHVGAGNPYYLRLQLNNGRNGSNNWREMSPHYFALDADSAVNSSSYNYLAYSFSSVEGYSLVSSYQGQDSFVYCGFRPQFLMIKSATSTEHWAIYDNKRSPSNHADDILKPNSSDDEDFNYGSGEIDILSNGFKLRGNWGAINHSSTPTYVFLAIAENPFKYARAR